LTAARNHVNRMCLAADVPLIESGSAGYLGQVTVIKKVQSVTAYLRNNLVRSKKIRCQEYHIISLCYVFSLM